MKQAALICAIFACISASVYGQETASFALSAQPRPTPGFTEFTIENIHGAISAIQVFSEPSHTPLVTFVNGTSDARNSTEHQPGMVMRFPFAADSKAHATAKAGPPNDSEIQVVVLREHEEHPLTVMTNPERFSLIYTADQNGDRIEVQ